jgi:TolA-binding protein
MTCKKDTLYYALALSLCLLLFLSRGINAQALSTAPPLPNYSALSTGSMFTPTQLQPSYLTLDELLTELSKEAIAQEQDLKNLSDQLAQSLTEIEELSRLLKQLELQLTNLESASNKERQQNRLVIETLTIENAKLKRSRDLWRAGGFALAAVAATLGAIVILR